MRALVVVESMFGNTRQVADAVAQGLALFGEVEVLDAGTAPSEISDLDLLVVGGPTHAFGMSRPSSRQDAARQGAAQGGTGPGLREWLAGVRLDGVRSAAAFDTRVTKVRLLPGSAARGAAKVLRGRGVRLMAEPLSFYVRDTPGPLADGEPERAREWGALLGRTVQHPQVRG